MLVKTSQPRLENPILGRLGSSRERARAHARPVPPRAAPKHTPLAGAAERARYPANATHVCMQGLPARAAFDKGAEPWRRRAGARVAATSTEEEEAKVATSEGGADVAHSQPATEAAR